MKLPKDFDDLLGQFGIERKSLMKLRFGGVVGKQALVGIGTVAAIAVVALKAENVVLLWGCLGGMIFVSTLVLVLNANHAHRHPSEAMLEGAELVVMQQLRNEMAAKGMNSIPLSPAVLEGVGKKKQLKETGES